MNLLEPTIQAVRSVLKVNQDISEGMIADIVAVLTGEKIAIAKNMQPIAQVLPVEIEPLKRVVKPKEAARMLGVGVKTLQYHARKHRIRTVCPEGSARSMGYVYDDILAMLKGDNSRKAA